MEYEEEIFGIRMCTDCCCSLFCYLCHVASRIIIPMECFDHVCPVGLVCRWNRIIVYSCVLEKDRWTQCFHSHYGTWCGLFSDTVHAQCGQRRECQLVSATGVGLELYWSSFKCDPEEEAEGLNILEG